MNYLRALGAFWWNFIIGDDWRVAVGVAVGLGVSAFLAHRGFAAWWVLPVTVALVLRASLGRATRGRD